MSNDISHLVHSTFTVAESEDVITIVAPIGTTCTASLAAYYGRENTFLFALDDPNDHYINGEFLRAHGARPMDIGRHMTSRLLFEGSGHPAEYDSRLTPDLAATSGAGGAPAVGYRAAQVMIDNGDFDELLQQLRSFCIQKSHGRPCRIVIIYIFSRAGGMGAGAWKPISLAIERTLASLGVPLTSQYQAMGSLTFDGLSLVAHFNDPCVLAALTDFCITPSEFLNSRRELHLNEAGVFGLKPEDRAFVIGVDHQAFSCRAMKCHRERLSTDLSKSNRFGAILQRDVQIQCSKSSVPAIQASCAEAAFRLLHPYAEPASPDHTLLRDSRWSNRKTQHERPSIEELAQNTTYSPEDMVELCRRPDATHDFSLLWDMGTHGRYDLGATDHAFAAPIISEQDLQDRRTLLATFASFIEEDLLEIEARTSELESLIASRSVKVQALWRSRKRAWTKRGYKKRTEKLSEELQTIRDAEDERNDLAGKRETLLVGKALTQRENDHLATTISDMLAALTDQISKLGPQRDTNLVASAPLSRSLPTLFELAKLAEVLGPNALYRLGGILTLRGLQVITGASAPRIEEIADAIVSGKCTFSSPPLGAYARSNALKRIFVIPPMEVQNGDLLRRAIMRRETDAIVFFADSFKAGAAVVAYEFRTFKDAISLFPGILFTDLKQAYYSEVSNLRFPDGKECVKRLGINL